MSPHRYLPLAAGALLMLSSAALAKPDAPAAPKFSTQLLALRSTYPKPPAYGPEPLMAMRFTPKSGERMHSPAIVFVDAAIGSNPLLPGQASRYAAERLAAMGYTVLSIFPRTDRGFGNTPFGEAALDIGTALDYLEAQGHEDLILASSGSGASVIADYVATKADPAMDMPGAKRVKALVMFAPPADDPRDWPGVAGTDYDARVAKARDLVAHPLASSDPLAGSPTIVTNGMIQSPAMFLDYFGPDAATRLSRWLPKDDVPTLIVSAAGDASSPADRAEQIRAAIGKDAAVTSLRYQGSDAAFAGLQDQAALDVAKWLASLKLQPRGGVTETVVDQTMADGSVQPGMFYAPASGIDPKKPVFVLQFGTTGDILHSSPQWLAWRLAERGYAVLSPRSRMAGAAGLDLSTYAEQRSDLMKWLDLLAKQGHRRVILEGHSLGGILVSNVAATGDPRVIGLVYMAPTRDSPTRAREGQGAQRYDALVEQARAAIAAGKGKQTVISYNSYPAWAKDNYKPGKGMIAGFGDMSLASHFMDFRGPDAPVHTKIVPAIKVPALAFGATQDPLMTKAFMTQFQKAYGGQLTPIWYEGTHGARESKTFVADTIARWTAKTFPDAP